MSDYAPVLVAALFAAASFIVASGRGVVGLLASGLSLALAAAALLLAFSRLPAWVHASLDVVLPWRVSLSVAAALAVVVLIVSRILLGAVLKWLFNPDRPLHRWSEGIAGGLLSLLPSAVTILVFFGMVRAAGTARELHHVAGLAREGVGEMGGLLPDYPKSARWRDAVESLPFVAGLLDAGDPFARRARRHAVALVLAQGGPELRVHFAAHPVAGPTALDPIWGELAAAPEIRPAIDALDYLAIATEPALQAAAGDPARQASLQAFPLRELLESFASSLPPAPRAEDAAAPET